MQTPKIHDRGRRPEIEGTRITVYDIMDYYEDGWPAGRIANWLTLRVEEVQCAINYIEANKEEVMAQCRMIVERSEKGNSPEVQAIYEASLPVVRAKMAEIIRNGRARKQLQI
jgi:uncharacterized protein (DUF433 family)